MAEIHITLSDTPDGRVAIRTDFKPSIGQPCTPAQGHALEIINRTQKQWGLKPDCNCVPLAEAQACAFCSGAPA